MEKIYERVSFTSKTSPTGYCPGCGHGTAHKLFARALEHFNLRDKTVLVYPVGCGGLAMPWINVNVIARRTAGQGRLPRQSSEPIPKILSSLIKGMETWRRLVPLRQSMLPTGERVLRLFLSTMQTLA